MPRDLRGTGLLLLVLAAPAAAQFAELATTDDGSQLYFTSQMLLKGRQPGQWPESRLYRFTRDGLTLYAERGALAQRDSGSSNDGVGGPSVSGDGAVLSLTYTGVCADAQCTSAGDRVEIRGRETITLPHGDVQISRNGRWALVSQSAFSSQPPLLVDLSTGRQIQIAPGISVLRDAGAAPASLTSAGAFLAATTTQIDPNTYRYNPGIWKDGNFTPLTIPDGFGPIALSDDGATIIADGARIRIASISLATGAVTPIAESQDTEQIYNFLSMSNDARRLLYSVSTPRSLGGPAYVWDAATASAIPIPLEPGEAVTSGILSGNGAIAFVATTHARIIRYDVASRAAASLFPQTPYCDDPSPIAAGSYTTLRCSFTGSVADLTGKLIFDGTPGPVLHAATGEIGVQVPWQRGFFASTLTLDVPSDSPFQGSQPLRVYDGAPAILPDARGLFGMKIVKGDWSGIATAVPFPGETFHIYMTGLGWPKDLETTGVPASLTTPNPIQWKLACELLPRGEPVDLLFAGLAPGMLGIYQTTFRMPELSASAPPQGFRCTLDSPVMRAIFGPGVDRMGVYGSGSIIIVPIPPTHAALPTRAATVRER